MGGLLFDIEVQEVVARAVLVAPQLACACGGAAAPCGEEVSPLGQGLGTVSWGHTVELLSGLFPQQLLSFCLIWQSAAQISSD